MEWNTLYKGGTGEYEEKKSRSNAAKGVLKPGTIAVFGNCLIRHNMKIIWFWFQYIKHKNTFIYLIMQSK